jgi:hypothetical protein
MSGLGGMVVVGKKKKIAKRTFCGLFCKAYVKQRGAI